jgi:hypothetical protein
MLRIKILVVIAAVGVLAGCAPGEKSTSAVSGNRVRLTVDFQKDKTLKYKFVSSRDITIDWGQMPNDASGKTKIDKSSETLDLVVTYTPVEVNEYGATTIKADCISAKVTRQGQSLRHSPKTDAAESFAGKSWTMTVGPTGKIEDACGLYDVIRQAGKFAFRADRSQGPVKEPDMIYDFIASQWFLWDSISSIPKPASGVKVGQMWKSKLFVPAPMILFAARDVNYTLGEVRLDANSQIAVINSSYSLFYPNPSDWPVPYAEAFQMSGTFGFLRGYRVADLQGQGQELFDVTAGRIEKDTQKYKMDILASLPLGLGINPKITIEQTMTMELLANPVTRAP